MCFDMRFERNRALCARERVCSDDLFARHLALEEHGQINACGHRAASRYEGLAYWDCNWRKGGGSQRMIEISKREEFYQQ